VNELQKLIKPCFEASNKLKHGTFAAC